MVCKMFMHQTLVEYLENPMGKGSTAIANRQLIKRDLENRYDRLILRYKKFDYKLWYDKNDFYFHVKIPSETNRTNTYDVVIMLTPLDDKKVISEPTLKNYYIKVFSNCPSFVFTYAYVYNDYDMLIDFLKHKYTDVTLTDNPVIKNPGEVINYDKSIFFACNYIMKHNTLLTKLTWAGRSYQLNKEKFASEIRQSDKILLEIKKEENRVREEAMSKLRVNKGKAKILTPKKRDKDTDKNKNKKATSIPKQSKITPQKKIKPKAKIKPR